MCTVCVCEQLSYLLGNPWLNRLYEYIYIYNYITAYKSIP